MDIQRYEEAKEMFERYLVLNPGDDEAKKQLEVVNEKLNAKN